VNNSEGGGVGWGVNGENSPNGQAVLSSLFSQKCTPVIIGTNHAEELKYEENTI
jgi:hypothetical protein